MLPSPCPETKSKYYDMRLYFDKSLQQWRVLYQGVTLHFRPTLCSAYRFVRTGD